MIGELTYFSLKDVSIGSIVQVPVRNKDVPALVMHSSDASDMRAILRGGDFTLRRIGVAPERVLVPESFIKTSREMASYYATTAGSIINTMLPKAILTSTVIIDSQNSSTKNHTAYALQASTQDRVFLYKNTIREELAKKKSVILITPTVSYTKTIYKDLSTGLQDRTYILHSKMTKVKQLKVFEEIHKSKKAVLLIATARYATLFRKDLGTIIIEDEASSVYSTLKRPYIDTSKFIRLYAQISGIRLILGSTVLSSKTQLALKQDKILELLPPSTRARSKVGVNILDTRDKNKKKFTAISDNLHKIIKKSIIEKKKIFILSPRRGLAPLTVCRDCKTPVLCDNCDTPITLRKKGTNREFLCYKCGETKDADTTCTYCNSWRLDTLGIGIELIEDELKKEYKNLPITRIDKQTTKTDKQILGAIDDFELNGGILLGTRVVIPFLDRVDISIVASLDAMLSIPSFEIDESVFSLLLQIKDITKESLYIQTRMPERNVLLRAKDGDISNFMREELDLRKILKYPPYTVMVKITRIGSKRQIIKDFQNIMPQIEPYGPRVFKQFYQLKPGRFALHALLRISTKDYPNKDLTRILQNIQPMFEVKVNIE